MSSNTPPLLTLRLPAPLPAVPAPVRRRIPREILVLPSYVLAPVSSRRLAAPPMIFVTPAAADCDTTAEIRRSTALAVSLMVKLRVAASCRPPEMTGVTAASSLARALTVNKLKSRLAVVLPVAMSPLTSPARIVTTSTVSVAAAQLFRSSRPVVLMVTDTLLAIWSAAAPAT